MFDDKKKTASLILKSMNPPKDTSGDPANPEDYDEGNDASEGLRAAAEEMIEHMHNKNADGLMQAMDSYYEMRGNASSYSPKTGQNDD